MAIFYHFAAALETNKRHALSVLLFRKYSPARTSYDVVNPRPKS